MPTCVKSSVANAHLMGTAYQENRQLTALAVGCDTCEITARYELPHGELTTDGEVSRDLGKKTRRLRVALPSISVREGGTSS